MTPSQRTEGATVDDQAELDPRPAGYAEAVEELETIMRQIEDDDVDVDLLATHVTRAAGLIDWCRGRILAARAAVDEATEGLEAD